MGNMAGGILFIVYFAGKFVFYRTIIELEDDSRFKAANCLSRHVCLSVSVFGI